MKLHLLVSGRCNLACTYCCQTARQVGPRMSRATAEAVLDTVLAVGEPPHSVTVSGGEPFLAPDLVRCIVRSVRVRAAKAGPIEFTVLTNGTLVTPEDIDFLAGEDVGVQVSFDGVESAQVLRAPGTSEMVQRVLDHAIHRHPGWARQRLSVGIMVQAATLPTLAMSVRRLMAMGVANVRVGPLLTHDAGWSRSARARLEAEMEELLETNFRYWTRTGDVALDLFREVPRASRALQKPTSGACSSISSPASVAVDPDGRAWACPSFVASVQQLPEAWRNAAAELKLGDVRDPGFLNRLEGLPQRTRRVPLLGSKARRWSSRGRCRDCQFFDECLVCPASTSYIPGHCNPERVAEHQCDFQFAALKARRRFLARIASPAWLFAPSRWISEATA